MAAVMNKSMQKTRITTRPQTQNMHRVKFLHIRQMPELERPQNE